MHIVITGASSGIGKALAEKFAHTDCKLSLIARRKELLENLAETLPGKTHIIPFDLSTPSTSTNCLLDAEETFGPIDVLINNAGVQFIEESQTMDVERGEKLLAINLLSPLRLIQYVLPGMISRAQGTIINIASMASLAPTAFMSYYNASKGGLAGASEALRGEVRKTGVNVVTVYPGIIHTAMGEAGLKVYEENLGLRFQPKGDTETLARLVQNAVRKQKARVIYPRMYILARWFPGITRLIMDRFTPPLRKTI